MRETGLVIKTDKNFASVKVQKKDECSKCGMCLFPKNADSITLNVFNSVGAKEGDTVLIENKSDSKLLGAILAFLVPLLLIIISALVALLVIGKDIYVLILSVITVALWYLLLPQIDKKLKKSKKFCAETLMIVTKSETEHVEQINNE